MVKPKLQGSDLLVKVQYAINWEILPIKLFVCYVFVLLNFVA